MEKEICTKCGSIIEGNTCQDSEENIICEDCLIDIMAHSLNLIKE